MFFLERGAADCQSPLYRATNLDIAIEEVSFRDPTKVDSGERLTRERSNLALIFLPSFTSPSLLGTLLLGNP